MIDPATVRLAPALAGLAKHLCTSVKGLAGQEAVVGNAIRGMKALGVKIEGNFGAGGSRKTVPSRTFSAERMEREDRARESRKAAAAPPPPPAEPSKSKPKKAATKKRATKKRSSKKK